MVAPFIGLKFAGKVEPVFIDLEDGASNTKMTLGVGVALLSDQIFGIEGELGHTPRFFEQSGNSELIAQSNVSTVMGNVIVAVPKRITRDSLRPYATGGLGLIHASTDTLGDVLPAKENLLGINVGGGAIGRLTNRTSIRIDVRHFRNIDKPETVSGLPPLTRISFWRATVGVALMGNLF
jgi:hypothetical protein